MEVKNWFEIKRTEQGGEFQEERIGTKWPPEDTKLNLPDKHHIEVGPDKYEAKWVGVSDQDPEKPVHMITVSAGESEGIRIAFDKIYDESTTWTVIVMDFLEVLSEKFGYTIDEYSLLQMPEAAKADRLGDLLENNSESQTYQEAFRAVIQEKSRAYEYANARRAKAAEVAKAMQPTRKSDED